MERYYPSKLLLFGEYTVLSGSQALAVPLSHWNGEWIESENKIVQSDSALHAYLNWLKENEMISPVIAAHIFGEMDKGWRYQSNIPIGYGLGSSGALVAALYDRYISDKNISSPSSLLRILSKMESYFHGSSSGMDPMVSLTGQAIYKDEKGEFLNVLDPGWPEGYEVYLLDSGIGRTTGPLVTSFKQMLGQPEFKLSIERELIPMVEHAIHFYLSGTRHMLEECIGVISEFQRKYFSKWIPDAMKKQWDETTERQGVYMKFCGAGGGGYFLVISTAREDLSPIKDLTRIL